MHRFNILPSSLAVFPDDLRPRSRLGAALVGAVVAVAAVASSALAQAPPGVAVAERTIVHDGLERCYLVAEPEGLCPGAPIVVVLHGGTQDMRNVLTETAAPNRWLHLAAEFGFIVISPNGYNVDLMNGCSDQQTWNDLRPSVGNPISEEDDAGFIAAMLDVESERLDFDERAVFVTGSSNGGMMSYRMLIEHSERFAAGAAFIANLPESEIPDPASPTPVMIMNGDADPLMPWEGGVVGANGAPVRSALDTLAYWRRSNDAEAGDAVTRLLPDIDATDGARIVEAKFFTDAAAPGDAPPVILYRMVNAGHAIPILPTDPQVLLPPALGVRCRDARGVDLAWAFFQQWLPALRAGPDLDGSGAVDGADLGLFLQEWRTLLKDGSATDFNSDGRVDGADLGILLQAWGACH